MGAEEENDMKATEILAGGFALLRNQPRAVAIWGALYLVMLAAALAFVWPALGDMAAFQQQVLTAQAAGLRAPPPPVGFFGVVFGLNIAILLVMVAIFAAAVRAVALGGDDVFGFLRLGMDELRLIGLGLLVLVIATGALVVLVILAVLLSVVLAAMLGQGAIALVFVGYFVAMLALIWVEVRISLAGALTVLRGRIVLREAWRLTRGRFWTLFGIYALMFIAFFAVSLLAVAVTNPELLTAYADAMQLQVMHAALARQQALIADISGPRMIVTTVVGSIVNIAMTAFAFGAVATAAIGFDRESNAANPPLPTTA